MQDERIVIYTAAGRLAVTRHEHETSVLGAGIWARGKAPRIERGTNDLTLWIGRTAFDLQDEAVAQQVADHLGIAMPPKPQQVAA